MSTMQTFDQDKLAAFMDKAVGNLSGTTATVLAFLGDRLGLFTALDARGPATAEELAVRAGIDPRYALEWLRGMTAAGYVEFDGERFLLPPEQAQAFAAEGGPFFLAGAQQELIGMLGPLDELTEAFRTGGGVPQSAYPADAWDGMRRFSQGWFDNLLLQEWIPAASEVRGKLETGARYADVGCGSGLAVIKLADAFPNSTFVGYDQFAGQIERARANADAAGVADRVRFEVRDVATGLPESFDVISTFDVVHDAIDPAALLAGIHAALNPGGVYLMLEMNSADDPAENTGPLATLFYGFSVIYCMTTSLAHGGAGLGTCGCPPATVRALSAQAGFSSVEQLPLDSPFNILYAIR
ncbi:class I SAM-dependent methyltransferase [Solirubrobacter soli]|uniref:class I SAM-dependent methyltransferase n=1 Tax=Solirubrobacter soli TaxID=363832 RepID=UPI00040D8D85|nr:class I SAM-dependent methyltransferase [Solirubrobacter soli]